jgi:hypothetical protein
VSFLNVGFSTKKFRARIAWQRRSPTRLTHSIPAFVPLQAHFAFPKEIAVGSSASSHRQRFRSGDRLVDPDFAGKDRWLGSAADEALRPRRAPPIGFWTTKKRAVPSAPGVGLDTSPQNGCCRATFGCRIGTIKKSASYEISGALERRNSALG